MAFYCNLFLQIVLGFLIWVSPSIAEEADRTIVAHDRSFDYILEHVAFQHIDL